VSEERSVDVVELSVPKEGDDWPVWPQVAVAIFPGRRRKVSCIFEEIALREIAQLGYLDRVAGSSADPLLLLV